MFNIMVGIVWQTSLVALPIYLVFHQFLQAFICFVIAGILSLILKKTWWDRLNEMDEYEKDIITIS